MKPSVTAADDDGRMRGWEDGMGGRGAGPEPRRRLTRGDAAVVGRHGEVWTDSTAFEIRDLAVLWIRHT